MAVAIINSTTHPHLGHQGILLPSCTAVATFFTAIQGTATLPIRKVIL